MSNTNEPDLFDAESKPLLESIKRLGHQARNWETYAAYGANLEILSPSQRRRLVVSPRLFFAVIAALVTVMALQTLFIYRELRAQRATIQQLSAVLARKIPPSPPKTESHSRRR